MTIAHRLFYFIFLVYKLVSSAVYPLNNQNNSESIAGDLTSSERSSPSSSIRSVPSAIMANISTSTIETDNDADYRRNLILDRPLSVIVNEEIKAESKFKRPAAPASKKCKNCVNS